MKRTLTIYFIGFLLITVLAVTAASLAHPARAAPAGPEVAIAWNAITPRTLITFMRHEFRQLCITLWILSKVKTGDINRILDRTRVPERMRLPQLPPTMCWQVELLPVKELTKQTKQVEHRFES